MLQVRILRRPHPFSELMPGDVTFWTPEHAERAVAAGIAEFVDGRPAPAPLEAVMEQLVDPAVEVLGDNEEARQRRDAAWRKSLTDPAEHKMVTSAPRKGRRR